MFKTSQPRKDTGPSWARFQIFPLRSFGCFSPWTQDTFTSIIQFKECPKVAYSPQQSALPPPFMKTSKYRLCCINLRQSSHQQFWYNPSKMISPSTSTTLKNNYYTPPTKSKELYNHNILPVVITTAKTTENFAIIFNVHNEGRSRGQGQDSNQNDASLPNNRDLIRPLPHSDLKRKKLPCIFKHCQSIRLL